jgi:hypothetical protein
MRLMSMCNMKAPIIKQHIGQRFGARGGEKLLHLPASSKQPDAEDVRDLMISYITGVCSQADGPSCDERPSAPATLATLAVVLLLLQSPVGEEEEKVLAALYTAGVEAARIARLHQKWKSGHLMRIDCCMAD